MKTKLARDPTTNWSLRLAPAFAYTAAVLLALIAFILVYTSMDAHRRMAQLLATPDALFGLSTRTILLLAGLLHLALCAAFFLVRDPMARGMLGTWAAWNYIIYRLGMAWLRAVTPFPAVQAVARKIGVQPNTLDFWWKVFIGYLLLGGAVLMALERQRLKHLKSDAFLRHWREIRQPPLAAPGPVGKGHKVPGGSPKKQEPDAPNKSTGEPQSTPPSTELKFSCPRCGQHIRCGAAYSGRPVSCPACKANIEVPQRGSTA
jgi:hypothetical protein